MITILHIITGLDTGGAESMLAQLVEHATSVQHRVVSLKDKGIVAVRIEALGITVDCLHLNKPWMLFSGLWKLLRILHTYKPTIVHTWLYHADLIGGGVAKLFSRTKIIWAIHLTHHRLNKRSTRFIITLCAFLSHYIPDIIVCVAESTKKAHVAIGYPENKMVVIENGVNTHQFIPNPTARFETRKQLGVSENTHLIGMVARFHPQKNHEICIRAAQIVVRMRQHMRFVFVGKDMSEKNNVLMTLLKKYEVLNYFYLLGEQSDIPQITASFDIATLSSSEEAFPLVIAEAMACEVPCVVTDVGDAARIIGDTGIVVPKNNPTALAHAWLEMIEMGTALRAERGKAARQRVTTLFSLRTTVEQYERCYASLNRQY